LAFGYILSQLKERPRLAVATHFQSEDDTIKPALEDIQCWYPEGPVAVTSDLMVINVTKSKIRQRRAVVSDFAWGGGGTVRTDLNPPKYNKDGKSDPYAQLDPNAPLIDPALYENCPVRR
jgi:ribonuclease Z